MQYITRNDIGITIKEEDRTIRKRCGLIGFINQLCKQNLSTYQGRKEAAKHLLRISQNVPIYVCRDIILIPTCSVRDLDCIYLNYAKILSIKNENENTMVLFDDLSHCILPVSYAKMNRQMKRVEQLLAHV